MSFTGAEIQTKRNNALHAKYTLLLTSRSQIHKVGNKGGLYTTSEFFLGKSLQWDEKVNCTMRKVPLITYRKQRYLRRS